MREYGILTLPANPSRDGGKYEMGWQFTVTEQIDVYGLRVYLPVAQTVVGHLWDGTSSAIRTVTITATADSWSEAEFDNPVTLQTGVTYTISCYNESTRYYASKSLLTYNSKVTYVSGVFNSSRNSKPTNRETSTIYPFIDILIGRDIYKANGTAVFTLANFAPSGGESLFWDAETPEDTSLQMYTKVDNGSWRRVSANAGTIQGLPSSGTCTLYIKAELATTDNTVTPQLKSVSIRSSADRKILVLAVTTPNDLRSNVGNMSVIYDGLGGLQGTGGPSAAFTGTFTPTSMAWRPNPNAEDHLEISVDANAVVTAITYSNTQETEHIEISAITMSLAITNIHDI